MLDVFVGNWGGQIILQHTLRQKEPLELKHCSFFKVAMMLMISWTSGQLSVNTHLIQIDNIHAQ